MRSSMHPLGKTLIRKEVKFIPAKLKLICYYQTTYECRECRKEGTPSIAQPVIPKPVIPHFYASPSSVSHVMVQKYHFAIPLYRQEKDWKQLGLPLSRTMLANWIIHASHLYLAPLRERMHTLLLEEPCLHADETPVQVMNEKGRKNTSKSYMWLYSSGEQEPGMPSVSLSIAPPEKERMPLNF